MKVYAQFIEKDGITYRLNTLLQFGDSWEHIGNAVLANPGSANKIKEIDDDINIKITNLYKNFTDRIYDRNNWFESNDDSTMRMLEKVFNGWYVDQNSTITLNGVIQLFNSFNVKNQYLEEAVSLLPLDNELLYPNKIEKYFNDKPTYFGFSNAVIYNNKLNPIVKSIFHNSSDKIKSFYKENFDENSFYHPMYINKQYNQKHFQKYKDEILIPFKKLIEEK